MAGRLAALSEPFPPLYALGLFLLGAVLQLAAFVLFSALHGLGWTRVPPEIDSALQGKAREYRLGFQAAYSSVWRRRELWTVGIRWGIGTMILLALGLIHRIRG